MLKLLSTTAAAEVGCDELLLALDELSAVDCDCENVRGWQIPLERPHAFVEHLDEAVAAAPWSMLQSPAS